MNVTKPAVTPNEAIFQVNFRADPLFLDKRGRWADVVRSRFDLTEWQISQDMVKVFRKDQSLNVIVAYNRLWISLMEISGPAQIIKCADELLSLALVDAEFGNSVATERIAVRMRFFTEYVGTFGELMTKHLKHFSDISDKAKDAFVPHATTLDLMVVHEIDTPKGRINFKCAPGKREQMRDVFSKSSALPEVGWYCDMDYFQRFGEGEKPFDKSKILSEASTFAEDTWHAHLRMRKLVYG